MWEIFLQGHILSTSGDALSCVSNTWSCVSLFLCVYSPQNPPQAAGGWTLFICSLATYISIFLVNPGWIFSEQTLTNCKFSFLLSWHWSITCSSGLTLMKEQMIGEICRRSSFFNRNTVSIVEQMVEGGCVEHNGCLGDDHARLLQQIEVPIQYVNHHFCDLFTGLLREKGILSLGIYRACGTLGSPTAYVLTNPLKETIINAGDLVYVLCWCNNKFHSRPALPSKRYSRPHHLTATLKFEMKQGLEGKLGPKDRVTLGIILITCTKLPGLFCNGYSWVSQC